MFSKNQFYVVLLILFSILNFQKINCQVNLDSIFTTSKQNLISIIEDNENTGINHIVICNKFVNEKKKDVRYDTLDFYFKEKLINISNKEYQIIIEDTICILMQYATKSIKITKIKDKVSTITEYFNFKFITNENVINFNEFVDKYLVNVKYHNNTIIPKKNNEMAVIINKKCFLEQINYVYYNLEDKVTQNQMINYKNNKNYLKYNKAFDFIFDGNKLKKEYENFKIIK